jgi:hypothetical protein
MSSRGSDLPAERPAFEPLEARVLLSGALTVLEDASISNDNAVPFHLAPVDATRSHTLGLQNTGPGALTVESWAVADAGGAFGTTQQNLPANPADDVTLAPGERHDLTVWFSPAAPGGYTGTLTIDSTDPAGPLEVSLSGTTYSQQFVGADYPAWGSTQWLGTESPLALAALAAAGAGTVAIVPTFYVSSISSNDIYVSDAAHGGKTVSHEAFQKACRDAHAAGLKLAFKPHVDVWDNADSRTNIQPADPAVWFEDYRQTVIGYYQSDIDALAAEGIEFELYVIGTELEKLSGSAYRDEWLAVIDEVRTHYGGPITYAANANDDGGREYTWLSFWDALDLVGIDAWFDLSFAAPGLDPPRAQLVDAWESICDPTAPGSFGHWVANNGLDKPVVLTEVGYRAIDGAHIYPNRWQSVVTANEGLQARCLDAMYDVITRQSWCDGTLLWLWYFSPADTFLYQGLEYSPQDRQAEAVVEFWWQGADPPPAVSDVQVNGSPQHSISSIAPWEGGVRTVEVGFSEVVDFCACGVQVNKVAFPGGTEVILGLVPPQTVSGSGTDRMTLTFAEGAAVNTWLKVTLSSAAFADSGGSTLDGDPPAVGSGRGYLFDPSLDLTSGDGAPGGDAVFYVGSLVADADGDGAVGESDAEALRAAWGARTGEPAYDPLVDLNADGRTNIQDAFGLNANWGAQLDALPAAVGSGGRSGGFPFTIDGDWFLQDGQPVFLNVIGYQPLEPGQDIQGEIRASRVQDDLRRLRAYQGGSDPVLLRVYAQPTTTYPIRMPQSFYDGVRELGFWMLRDIYFDADYWAADAIDRGKQKIDAVLAEVEAVGGFDRIFAWEIGNEFSSAGGVAALEQFVEQMTQYIKQQMALPGRDGYSDWVTWASWPPNDPLRTDGAPVMPDGMDFISYNAYSYDPQRIRDHQAGPGTGTQYAGYLAALKSRYPGKPLVISESGLPDSSSAEGLDQDRLHPWYPAYRRGGLSEEQTAEGVLDRYFDARLSGAVAGFTVFEWLDEWHKAGDPATHDDHPEEHFGLHRFQEVAPGEYELEPKLIEHRLRHVYAVQWQADPPVLSALAADDPSLGLGASTTVRATVSPEAEGPVYFRWETDRGFIVGDGDTVEFYSGDNYLGSATVTCAAIDAEGRATRLTTAVEITPTGGPQVELLTLGTSRASGVVRNVDLDACKLVCWIETSAMYVQPYTDVNEIWVGPDGYWWTQVHNGAGGELVCWVTPAAYEPPDSLPKDSPPPPGTVATAALAAGNDADNDLLPDDWEELHFPGQGLAQDIYGDPEGDTAQNLEELLAATNPTIADNDADADGLWDNWERRYFGRLAYGAADDPDADGIANADEQTRGIHPGRTRVTDVTPPAITAVQIGGLADRTISSTDSREAGLGQVTVTFSEAVLFDAGDILVQTVTGQILPTGVTGSGTDTMTITLPAGAAVNTWVKLTLSGTGTVTDLAGNALDGDAPPGGSGRGYLYDENQDLPSGDGIEGGAGVFYVGSLIGDATGDGVVNDADADALRAAWGARDGEAGYDPLVDFNGDGRTNLLDAFLLNQNWAAALDPLPA